ATQRSNTSSIVTAATNSMPQTQAMATTREASPSTDSRRSRKERAEGAASSVSACAAATILPPRAAQVSRAALLVPRGPVAAHAKFNPERTRRRCASGASADSSGGNCAALRRRAALCGLRRPARFGALFDELAAEALEPRRQHVLAAQELDRHALRRIERHRKKDAARDLALGGDARHQPHAAAGRDHGFERFEIIAIGDDIGRQIAVGESREQRPAIAQTRLVDDERQAADLGKLKRLAPLCQGM